MDNVAHHPNRLVEGAEFVISITATQKGTNIRTNKNNNTIHIKEVNQLQGPLRCKGILSKIILSQKLCSF